MTDTLPRHIADLVGIIFGEAKGTSKPIPKPAPRLSPIQMIDNKDGTFTLMRYRKTVGWISHVHLAGDHDGYRAQSVHGETKNCYSLRTARDFLLSSYH